MMPLSLLIYDFFRHFIIFASALIALRLRHLDSATLA